MTRFVIIEGSKIFYDKIKITDKCTLVVGCENNKKLPVRNLVGLSAV
jgi:hypothetical protein